MKTEKLFLVEENEVSGGYDKQIGLDFLNKTPFAHNQGLKLASKN